MCVGDGGGVGVAVGGECMGDGGSVCVGCCGERRACVCG